tara:strand:+ start:1361 stop:1876 length:516 start_codon:yes stop_codon:yes gene_type:complete
MNFATYLPVPPELLALNKSPFRRDTAIITGWLGLDHRLLDGTRIRPSIKTARNAIAWARDGVTIPIVVQEGYVTRKEGETTHTVEEFVERYRRSQEEIDILIYEIRTAAGGFIEIPVARDAADSEEGRVDLVMSLLDKDLFTEQGSTITLVRKERSPRYRTNDFQSLKVES